MNQAFLDYFRCPEQFADFRPADRACEDVEPSYFKFGPDVTCYGKSWVKANGATPESLPDALEKVQIKGTTCILPFDPNEVANNLRYERYVDRPSPSSYKSIVRKIYYAARPAMPVSIRRHFQRRWLKGWSSKPFPRWPVDRTVDKMFTALMRLTLDASPHARIPFIWFWPEGKSSCAVMTHDVETAAGLKFSQELMDINDSFGIKSSFQIIPNARYLADEKSRSVMKNRGFEVNVHDLKHDGHLFDDHEQFVEAAAKINAYVTQFGSKGYRSGVLYRNLEWYEEFRFSYDMSVPNVAHLDPQPGGCCTVMPFFIGDILELPVTTTQDYSLFNVLQTFSQDLWQEQIRLITQQHGLMNFIVHPDYLDTVQAKTAYKELLLTLSSLREQSGAWIALPGDVDSWWRQRNEMKLVPNEDGWRIIGDGAERAQVAYATLKDDELTYVFP
jgi:hypothetical protein